MVLFLRRVSHLGIRLLPETHFRNGISHLVLFIAGFFAYTAIGTILCRVKAGDSSYVDAMFLWGSTSAGQCLSYIRDEFRILFLDAAPILYHPLAGVICFLDLCGLMLCTLRTRSTDKLWYLAALFLLACRGFGVFNG